MSLIKEKYTLTREGDLWVTTVKDQRFGFRKWTWGEKNDLSGACTSVNPITGEPAFNATAFNSGLFLKTVRKEVDGKFVAFTEEEIKNIDGQLGECLSQLTQRLNLVSRIETQNL